MPLILDADIGSAPDSAITVAIAAAQPNLSLVLTSDESDGRRARLARHLLDLLGRTDVPVVAGRELGGEAIWIAGDSNLEETATQHGGGDVRAAVETVLSGHNGQVSWVGLGPISNLADLLSTNPEVRHRLAVSAALNPGWCRHRGRSTPPIFVSAPEPPPAQPLQTSQLFLR